MTDIICQDNLGNERVLPEESFIPRDAAYGILVQDGLVLMVQDAVSSNWEFPGGGLEHGESLLQGLRREFFEETGLMIEEEIQEACRFTEYFFDIKSNQAWKGDRSFYLVSIKGGEILEAGNGDDVEQARWMSLDELEDLRIKDNIRDVIGSFLSSSKRQQGIVRVPGRTSQR